MSLQRTRWLLLLAVLASCRSPPTPPEPLLTEILPDLAERYGVPSAEALRQRLVTMDIRHSDRDDLWLLSRVGDQPTQLLVAKQMVADDPYDLEAVGDVAEITYRLQGPAAALEAIAFVKVKDLVVRAKQQAGDLRAGRLDVDRCAWLDELGRKSEAHERCAVAAQSNAPATALTMEGRLALEEGQVAEAITLLNRAIGISDRFADRFYFLGLAEQANHQPEAAEQALHSALEIEPTLTVAQSALDGRFHSPAEGLSAYQVSRRYDDAARLAGGGHILLDLNLPDRAERCFAAADHLAVGPGRAMRIAHRADTDLAGALSESDSIGPTETDPYLLTIRAWLLLESGRASEARPWLDRVLRTDPRNHKAHAIYIHVCDAEGDWSCANEHRRVLGLPQPVNKILVAILTGSLLVLGMAWLFVRRRRRAGPTG